MSRASRLLATTALVAIVVSGCANGNLPPLEPDAPKLAASFAPPPLPPQVIMMPKYEAPPPPKDGIVRLTKSQRVGASYHVPAGADRVYPVYVGTGGANSGPQQVMVELPPNEQLQFAMTPNPELLSVQHVKTGSARDWKWTLVIKPLGPDIARVENLSVLTDKNNYRIDVHVKSGRANNMTLKLLGEESASGGAGGSPQLSGIASDALCIDNNFTWEKTAWWAPLRVCVLATPNGTYQTGIFMPPNIQRMPVVHAWSAGAEGAAEGGIVNSRVTPDRVIWVDGVHPGLRLTGDGPPIDIIRGGAS